ncbi:unnamed protein product [Brassicogethes aeneus]|uniref:TIR domain-containing protein n=1 Tax=Brassicogethes aeneus TaxID=1431903 RepID=A0A9P0FEQ3_BRAAE|nr:unnamed protein product [Brassicogethes aeneus]
MKILIYFLLAFGSKSVLMISLTINCQLKPNLIEEILNDRKTYLELSINNCPELNISETFFKHFPKLIKLKLHYINFVNPQDLNLSVLLNLKELQIRNTNLQVIPSAKLKNLRKLDMFSNNIRSISLDMFNGNENLEKLFLNYNKIEFVGVGILKNLKKLKYLSLMGNNIKLILNTTFQHHSTLTTIDLRLNANLILSNAFASLNNLIKIDLEGCNLTDIPLGLFDNQNNLEELNLRNNSLKQLSSAVFQNLTKLKTLNLGYNFLYLIKNEDFYNQKYLTKLVLNHNNISNIEEEAFTNLEAVKEIDLSYNMLIGNYMSDMLFYYIKKLEVINLRKNSISVGPHFYLMTDSYIKIDFSENKIQKVILTNLLSTKSAFYNFSNNQIKKIDMTGLESSKNTVQLNLDNNPILCDCTNYDFITSIPTIKDTVHVMNYKTIKCSESKTLYYFYENKEIISCPMASLKSDHYICPEKCTCHWRPFNSTFLVDCSNKALKEVPKFLAPKHIYNKMVKNVMVNLQNNELIESPSEHNEYENVTGLILSKNKIRNVTWVPSNIQVLYLDNNNISSLNDQLIDALYRSSFIDLKLEANPWICDCSVLKLKKYLTSLKMDKTKVYCNGTNRTIVDADNLCISKEIITVVSLLVIIFLLFLVACLMASYYKWKKYIKMWLYYKGWLLWFVSEEDIDKDKVYDVFLSFSEKDDDFVLKKLLPALESNVNPYKVCVHYRDWIPGLLITEQILTSVKDSRRTLVVLSKNFLNSCWTKMEFRTAYTQALKEGRARVIVVIYEEVDLSLLDKDFKTYLKMNTYIRWEDPWFWQRIFYALPHRKQYQDKSNIMLTLNKDKV